MKLSTSFNIIWLLGNWTAVQDSCCQPAWNLFPNEKIAEYVFTYDNIDQRENADFGCNCGKLRRNFEPTVPLLTHRNFPESVLIISYKEWSKWK